MPSRPVASSDELKRTRLPSVEPIVTVVVPTRNEQDSVPRLVERLERLGTDLPLGLLFVDDSTDGTPLVMQSEARRSPLPIRVLHRPADRRDGGLGGAVKAGIEMARTPYVCVMDADLQHPPELLGEMMAEARRSSADVVVASRYREGGDIGDFGPLRRLVSRACTMAAQTLFPKRLREVSDPMSGYFLVRRGAVDLASLRPRGFKILLEILVATGGLVVREVAFSFGERVAGESKASLREARLYLRRLLELRAGPRVRRIAAFGSVGALGVAVNSAVMALLVGGLHVWYLTASVLATQVAIASNYALSEFWVFRDRKPRRSGRFRMASYFALNNGTLLISGPLLVVLVSVAGFGVLTANLLIILTLASLRFAVADAVLWGSTSDDADAPGGVWPRDLPSVGKLARAPFTSPPAVRRDRSGSP